jgi:uncharacterized Zn finger protein
MAATVHSAPNSSSINNAWWSQRWAKFMQQVHAAADPTLLRGLRVKRLEVRPGLIQAQVVDRDNGAIQVEVRLPLLTDAQWDAVIDALAGQAIFAAQLLAGVIPAEIEQVFVEAGSWLLPSDVNEIEQRCTPAQDSTRVLSAVYRQLGEMVAEDPWLLLQLRGRNRQQVLDALQERRNHALQEFGVPSTSKSESAGSYDQSAFYMPTVPDRAQEVKNAFALEASISDFWGRRKTLEDVHYHLVRPAAELALLRRLGPISSGADGMKAYQQLQELYHRVTLRAWEMAFSPDDDEFNAGEGDENEAGE